MRETVPRLYSWLFRKQSRVSLILLCCSPLVGLGVLGLALPYISTPFLPFGLLVFSSSMIVALIFRIGAFNLTIAAARQAGNWDVELNPFMKFFFKRWSASSSLVFTSVLIIVTSALLVALTHGNFAFIGLVSTVMVFMNYLDWLFDYIDTIAHNYLLTNHDNWGLPTHLYLPYPKFRGLESLGLRLMWEH